MGVSVSVRVRVLCVCGHGFGMLCQEGGANGCLGGVMDKSLIALEVVL